MRQQQIGPINYRSTYSPDFRRRSGSENYTPSKNQRLNSGTRALLITIRSGVLTHRFNVRRLPNQTDRSAIAGAIR